MPGKIKINAFFSNQFALDTFIPLFPASRIEPTLLKSDFYNKLIGSLGFQGIKLLNCVVYCISILGRGFLHSTLCGMKNQLFSFNFLFFNVNFLHTMLIVRENFSQRYINDNENKWRFSLAFDIQWSIRIRQETILPRLFGILLPLEKHVCKSGRGNFQKMAIKTHKRNLCFKSLSLELWTLLNTFEPAWKLKLKKNDVQLVAIYSFEAQPKDFSSAN